MGDVFTDAVRLLLAAAAAWFVKWLSDRYPGPPRRKRKRR